MTESSMSSEHSLSREQAAGFDPAKIAQMVCILGGAGAAGNNVACNLALMGPGEMRIIDFDRTSLSNYPRSPGFAIAGVPVGTSKARALARATTRLMPPGTGVVRYADAMLEELGLGIFMDATVVIGAVDSKPGRAYLANATRLLGIPFVEIGFHYPWAHVAIYANRSDGAPCWRCREPDVGTGHFSCERYARRVVEMGRVPATQPLAAVAGALAAEACLRLAHGDTSLDDTFIAIDLRGMTAETMRLAPAVRCSGNHTRIPDPVRLDVDHHASVRRLFESVSGMVAAPVLYLRGPFVVAAPCARCGACVGIGKPEWVLPDAPPTCAVCAGAGPASPARINRVGDICPSDELCTISLRKLGYRAGDVVLVKDEESDRTMAFRLLGQPGALLTTASPKGARAGGIRVTPGGSGRHET